MGHLKRHQIRRLMQRPDSIAFDINEWLKEGGRVVTRRELYEFVSRLEVGRRMRNRWPSRLRRLARRLWGFLSRTPLDVEDPFYR